MLLVTCDTVVQAKAEAAGAEGATAAVDVMAAVEVAAAEVLLLLLYQNVHCNG